MIDNTPLIVCLCFNGIGWVANGIILYLILSKGSVRVKYEDKEVVVGEQTIKKAEKHIHEDSKVILDKLGGLEELIKKNGKK